MESQTPAAGIIATSYVQQPVALAVLAAVLALAAAARVLVYGGGGEKTSPCPPTVPFWLPFVGHVPHMLIDKDGFLGRLRDRYPGGVFSLRLCGRLHHFVHGPSLAHALLNRTAAAAGAVSSSLLVSNFGFSKADQAHHATMASEAKMQYKHLLSEPGLGELVDATVAHARRNIVDLVTFNSRPADQADWERLAGALVVDAGGRETVVEADLMELTRNFIAQTANRALYGTDFVQNFPDMWQLLWTFDQAFLLLAARIPAWVPWPRLRRARVARAKMLSYTRQFNVAMDHHFHGRDPGAAWQDLDNVSTVVRARLDTFRKHGLSLDARASCDLGLCWAMNANANQLVPWMLFELYRDPVLLDRVREEIAPYMVVTQPDNDFGAAIWVPPTLDSLDLDGLIAKCPLLKAAYIETLRVYTGTWTMRHLNEDVMLGDKAKAEPYLLQKGTYAHVSQEMHQLDPEYFPNPSEWHHERHLRECADANGHKTLVADMGTMRPYGGGPGMCKGRAFALREMLFYAAAILSFYDMQPPRGQGWEAPETYKLAATRHPKSPIKVWIKRRPQPSARARREAEASSRQ